MRSPWRLLALAAAITVSVASGVATAQTVSVIKAPPGAAVELVLNTTAIASTTATATGTAVLDVNLTARRGKDEIDATIFVDVCGDLRRILLIEPGVEGMPVPADCIRREISGVYVVRPVTSFVVNVAEPMPSVRFRQGRAPEAWLDPDAHPEGEGRDWGPLPTGLIAFGGAGVAMSQNQALIACGNVADCSGSGNRFALNAGIDVWFAPFLAVEGSFLRPADVTTTGRGLTADGGHRFTNYLDIRMATAGGKVGIPVGPVRLYGKGGITYSRLESVTTQTIYTSTDVGEEYPTIEGGTQNFGLRNTGWGWYAGGGGEIWVSRRLAVYGEMVYTPVGGDSSEGGEGSIKETVTSILGGIRFAITR